MALSIKGCRPSAPANYRIGYRTNYTHVGRYYTLADIPVFDDHGLWFSAASSMIFRAGPDDDKSRGLSIALASASLPREDRRLIRSEAMQRKILAAANSRAPRSG